MIININALERVIEINIEKYYPVHSYIKLECPKDKPKYTILCMNQQVMTVEEYIELRRQTANIEINEYLIKLLQTGLKYVLFAAPILLIDHVKETEELKKSKPDKNNYVIKRNVLIEIEKLMQGGVLSPHTSEISKDQSDIPVLLENIFPQSNGVFIGRLLYDKTNVYIPIKSLPVHLGIIGTTGSGKSNLMQVMINGAVDHNLEVKTKNLTNIPLVSSLAIDPHDEYALGPEGRGLYHLVNLLDLKIRNDIFGSFFYLYPRGTRIQSKLSPFSLECVINYEEITPLDVLNVQSFTGVQSEVMEAEHYVAHDGWIENILTSNLTSLGHHPSSTAAVRRRLRPIERSNIFRPQSANSSTLPEIIYALESGKILDFNCSLLSDFEMFLFNTVVARTIFNIRKALKASATMTDFKAQLYSRLPNLFVKSYDNKLNIYIKKGNEVKDPTDMPIVVFTIEEAPSILNPDLMRGPNIFKDIARQGRKFHISLAVISQQISTLDNAIISNLNTYIDLPVGSDKERRGLIDNASSSIQINDLKSLEGTLGVSIINGNWLTKFQKIIIPRYKDHFEENKAKYGIYKSKGTKTPLI